MDACPLRVGLAVAPDDAEAGEAEHALLAQLRPSHLHLVLDGPGQRIDWPGIARLQQAAGGAALRVDVPQVPPASPGAALAPLAAALEQAAVTAEAVAVFPSTRAVVQAAREAFPRSAIGGGTPFFFTQLNRIEGLGTVDFLSFTTSALVHGADDESVMAGLHSLPAMLATLAARHAGLAVRVGPSGIAARASPLGRQPPSDGSRRLALVQRDPRSRALFGAAWLVGYLARLAGTGACAVTLRSLGGDEGLLSGEGPCPAAFVLAGLDASAIHAVDSTAPHRALALRSGGALWIANVCLEPVEIEAPPGVVRVQCLDADGWSAWRRGEAASPWRSEPLFPAITLAACGVLQLQCEEP